MANTLLKSHSVLPHTNLYVALFNHLKRGKPNCVWLWWNSNT